LNRARRPSKRMGGKRSANPSEERYSHAWWGRVRAGGGTWYGPQGRSSAMMLRGARGVVRQGGGRRVLRYAALQNRFKRRWFAYATARQATANGGGSGIVHNVPLRGNGVRVTTEWRKMKVA